MNKYLKSRLAYANSIDMLFYATAFPLIEFFVNKTRTLDQYVIPGIIMCLFGSILDSIITSKEAKRRLYEGWFTTITLFDACIWCAYFALWFAHVIPDNWYPIASAVMHVSTVKFSCAIRQEMISRIFPRSEDRVEFTDACNIIRQIENCIGGLVLLCVSIKSIEIAKAIMLFAMTVDNGTVLWIHHRHRNL